MTIDNQIRDKKLQCNINREAAKISVLSSGKICKDEYFTGEDILPSNQQQIIEQAKFTYSPLGKAFEKQIKTIEDQGQKQVDALKDLKPKAIEGESNDKSKVSVIFNDLINERNKVMNELYDSADYNNLKFKYVDSEKNKDVSFYEHMSSKQLLNKIKSSQIKLSEAKNKQNEFLNKLNNIKIGRKNIEQQKVIINLENFYKSREEVFNFFKDYLDILLYQILACITLGKI